MTYNGTPVFNGDTSPSLGDGTDFGTIRQSQDGSTEVTHEFRIRNTSGVDIEFTLESFEIRAFGIDRSGISETLPAGGEVTLPVTLLAADAGLKSDEIFLSMFGEGVSESFGFGIRGYVSAQPVDLGVVGAAPVTASGQVEVTNRSDGAGNHPRGHKPATYRFGLSGVTNDLSVGLTARPHELLPSGEVQIAVTRDRDGDGFLDADELAVADPTETVANDGASHPFFRPGLAAGFYFVELSSAEAGSGLEDTIVTDFDLSLSAASVPGPDVRVVGASDIAPGDDSPSDAEGTTFGTAAVGGERPSRQFTVTNTGGSVLELGAPTVSGGFEVVSGPPPALAPGESGTFVVEMATAAAGAPRGTVRFTTNAFGKPEFTFDVSGVVEAPPPAQAPEITVSVEGVATELTSGQSAAGDLGATHLGQAGASRTFVVRNDGTGPLSISNVVVPSGFVVTEPLAASLAPSASDTFTVTLTGDAVGTPSGPLQIFTNDADENPFTVNLTGVVLAPQPQAEQPDVTAVSLSAIKFLTSFPSGGRRARGSLVATLRNDSGRNLAVPVAVAFQAVLAGSPGAAPTPLRVTTKRLKLRAGASRLLKAKVSLNSLPPGTYTLTATATADGKTSTVAGPTITVLAPAVAIGGRRGR